MNELVTRFVAGVVLMTLAAIVMLAGLGFLLAALYLGLLRYLDPAAAALAVGLAAFLLALVLMLIARRSSRSRRRPLPRRPGLGVIPGEVEVEVEAGAAELGMRLANEGQRLARSHAKGAALTALCAGLAVGISPRLRRALWRHLQ